MTMILHNNDDIPQNTYIVTKDDETKLELDIT